MPSNVTPKRPRGRPPGSKTKPKPVLDWQDRLKLRPGETLRKSGYTKSGTFDQREVEMYDVIDAQGQIVGRVTYTATTPLKPPHCTSYWLVQRDMAGQLVVEVRW